MNQAPTPYDTGERLEPYPWVNDHTGPAETTPPDRFGRVDFDDEEGCTILSLYVEPIEHGHYILRVERYADTALTVEVRD